MKWFYAEDEQYYTESYRQHLQQSRNISKVLICPSTGEVVSEIRAGKNFGVIASYLPPPELKALFTVEELPNRYGILTTQDAVYLAGANNQEERLSRELKVIEKKIGLRIYKPIIDKEMLVGLTNIKRFILGIKEIRDPKLRPKGIFLVGLPGTGKSFSAKYAASELEAYLVELNLSRLMESTNPVFLLDSIFRYLENASRQAKFVIWIDEIEKMFGGGQDIEKKVLGQLLTILNDMNTTGYKINGIFWATANDISAIVERNPEFLRKGRFDELFFIDNPYIEQAKEIARVYEKYYKVRYCNVMETGRTLADDMETFVQNFIYPDESMVSGSKEGMRFLYVPSEIEQIVKELARRSHFNQKAMNGHGSEILKVMYPLSATEKLWKPLKLLYDIEYLGSGFFDFVAKHIGKAIKRGCYATELDLMVVLTMMEPLSSSMKESIAKIRSNEKFFVKAD